MKTTTGLRRRGRHLACGIALLLAAASLGGCVIAPYPYYPHYYHPHYYYPY